MLPTTHNVKDIIITDAIATWTSRLLSSCSIVSTIPWMELVILLKVRVVSFETWMYNNYPVLQTRFKIT